MGGIAMKKVLLPLAPGFEEIEVIAVVDILRRAGIEVTIAGTSDGLIKGKNGVKVKPDELLADVPGFSFDMIVLAGGEKGVEHLKKDSRVIDLLKEYAEFKLIGAICASPTVLKAAGITKGRKLTCYPSEIKEFPNEYVDKRVVVDGNLITSQGPGTAMEFAYAIVEALVDKETAQGLCTGLLSKV
jgi:4-methyl-5(b-hydroxyethyl)-thiazole monophosphate biosynthesis